MTRAVIYQHPTCSTCKKALAWLKAQGVPFESVRIADAPPSADELEALMRRSGLPAKRFFNTSGQSYRQGEFGRRLPTMTEAEALDALAADGKLIKRPLVEAGGRVLVGFQADEWELATKS